VQIERRRQPVFVGCQSHEVVGSRGHITGWQARVERGHPVLEPADARLAYRPEPEPVVTKHHGDGVVQQPAVQQLGQRAGRPLIHGRRRVYVVVTERVQPEHGKVTVVSV